MELKEQITSKFNKDSFEIDSMGAEGGIDPYIIDFVLKLNASKDIMTIYSCEGHKEDDSAYLYFNVSEDGWDKFWLGVIPELSVRFLDSKRGSFGMYQTNWNASIKDNEYNTGISIHSLLRSFDIVTWEENKENFWKIIEEVFLKYFK